MPNFHNCNTYHHYDTFVHCSKKGLCYLLKTKSKMEKFTSFSCLHVFMGALDLSL